jgi:hypothetical protein
VLCLSRPIVLSTAAKVLHGAARCCESCHSIYDLSLIDLPVGGRPGMRPGEAGDLSGEIENSSDERRNSPEGKLLREIFGEDVDEKSVASAIRQIFDRTTQSVRQPHMFGI